MADFAQVMKDWRRMCETIQSENQEKQQSSWCKGCPIQYTCILNTVIKDSTDNVFTMISKQIETWAEENPEPIYPLWGEWLISIGAARREPNGIPFQLANGHIIDPPYEIAVNLYDHIPADIAQKLGIEPKENV